MKPESTNQNNLQLSVFIVDTFEKNGFTNHKGEPIRPMYGLSEKEGTAFIIEAYNNEKKKAVIVTIMNERNEIAFRTGLISENGVVPEDTQIEKTFKLTKNIIMASQYLEKIIHGKD